MLNSVLTFYNFTRHSKRTMDAHTMWKTIICYDGQTLSRVSSLSLIVNPMTHSHYPQSFFHTILTHLLLPLILCLSVLFFINYCYSHLLMSTPPPNAFLFLSSSRFCQPRGTPGAISKKFITCRMYWVQYPSPHLNATSTTHTFVHFTLLLCFLRYRFFLYTHLNGYYLAQKDQDWRDR